MRTWVIKYWIEKNDVCSDFDEEVIAYDIEEALKIFKEQRTRYRIESIIELTKNKTNGIF